MIIFGKMMTPINFWATIAGCLIGGVKVGYMIAVYMSIFKDADYLYPVWIGIVIATVAVGFAILYFSSRKATDTDIAAIEREKAIQAQIRKDAYEAAAKKIDGEG